MNPHPTAKNRLVHDLTATEVRLRAAGFKPVVCWVDVEHYSSVPLRADDAGAILDKRNRARKR